MIDLGVYFLKKSLSQVFGRIKLHKKKSRNIYSVLSLESYRDF